MRFSLKMYKLFAQNPGKKSSSFEIIHEFFGIKLKRGTSFQNAFESCYLFKKFLFWSVIPNFASIDVGPFFIFNRIAFFIVFTFLQALLRTYLGMNDFFISKLILHTPSSTNRIRSQTLPKFISLRKSLSNK